MRLKNVPRNLPRYARRAFTYYRNSGPFLSGDLFASESDVNVYPPKLRGFQPGLNRVSTASVIFCPSHYLEQFLEDYSGSINAKVLVLGNSDRDFLNFDFRLPKTVKAIFAQNLHYEDSRTRILPIGIENFRLATNGLPRNFSDDFVFQTKDKSLILGPLSQTHPEREFILNFKNPDENHITFLESRITPREYARVTSQFKFVASPRGNGLDTHRFWETLYRGSSPVVLKSEWAATFQRHGLPIRQIENWSSDNLAKISKSDFEIFVPSKIPSLWWQYWKESINSFL
jgi:hypothetical protein